MVKNADEHLLLYDIEVGCEAMEEGMQLFRGPAPTIISTVCVKRFGKKRQRRLKININGEFIRLDEWVNGNYVFRKDDRSGVAYLYWIGDTVDGFWAIGKNVGDEDYIDRCTNQSSLALAEINTWDAGQDEGQLFC